MKKKYLFATTDEALNAARTRCIVKVTSGQSFPSPREFQTLIGDSNALHPSTHFKGLCPSKGVGHRGAHFRLEFAQHL